MKRICEYCMRFGSDVNVRWRKNPYIHTIHKTIEYGWICDNCHDHLKVTGEATLWGICEHCSVALEYDGTCTNPTCINWNDEDECIEAVIKYGRNLAKVKHQTPKICMEAVKHAGWALQYVKEQTPELCLEAVKSTPWVLEYVKDQTPEICIQAIVADPYAMKFIKIPLTEEMEREIVILTI